MKRIKLLSVKKLKSGKKKYVAEFEITTKYGKKDKISKRSTTFGAKGMSDYTIHKDVERRNRYIKRHTKDLRTNDPTRAGFLSMYILWNKKSYKSSLSDYKRRLNIYNKTGKFPKSISGSSLKSKFGVGYDLDIPDTYLDKLPPELKKIIIKKLYEAHYDAVERKKKLCNIKYSIKFYVKLLKLFDEYHTPNEINERLNRPNIVLDPLTEYTRLFIRELALDVESGKFNKACLFSLFWKELITRLVSNYVTYNPDAYPHHFTNEQLQNMSITAEWLEVILIKMGMRNDFNTDDPFWYNEAYNYLYYNLQNNIGNMNFGKSYYFGDKVPDNVKNPKLYLKIKAKIKKDVKAKNRRWGAYDSGRLVREYKQAGGKYSGSKKSKTQSSKSSNLNRWYKEKWIDACAWPKRKSCGRTKASIKSKVTYCRPSKIIDSNTPTTVQELTKTQIKKRCSKKSKNPKRIVRK